MLRTFACTAALLGALPAFADDDPLLTEARSVGGAIPPKLVGVLAEEITKNGAAQAITVCREKAPAMAKEASEKSGWAIRRVSLKNRNPKAVPDAWERAVLEEFDRRAAAGEDLSQMDKGETVMMDGKPVYRYMKAVPTQQLCVQCHGKSELLAAAVRERLNELYPNDKATGYDVGAIRGAMTLKKPL